MLLHNLECPDARGARHALFSPINSLQTSAVLPCSRAPLPNFAHLITYRRSLTHFSRGRGTSCSTCVVRRARLQALVFCNDRLEAVPLAAELNRSGFPSAVISGADPQCQRASTVRERQTADAAESACLLETL
eukprot:6174231-Pleurochrysis_carterae.AAC.2